MQDTLQTLHLAEDRHEKHQQREKSFTSHYRANADARTEENIKYTAQMKMQWFKLATTEFFEITVHQTEFQANDWILDVLSRGKRKYFSTEL